MRTETEEIRDNLKYLSLLARDYPSQAAAASEIISTQALLKLPKGTEHFMSDLHGEHEAFVHILNTASGVIREKIDTVLGDTVPAEDAGRAGDARSIIPIEKLPAARRSAAPRETLQRLVSAMTLLRLIDLCRFVSSKHTRDHVRALSAARTAATSWTSCFTPTLRTTTRTYVLRPDHRAASSANDRADDYHHPLFASSSSGWPWTRLHIVGDLFDRGPRPDVILDTADGATTAWTSSGATTTWSGWARRPAARICIMHRAENNAGLQQPWTCWRTATASTSATCSGWPSSIYGGSDDFDARMPHADRRTRP